MNDRETIVNSGKRSSLVTFYAYDFAAIFETHLRSFPYHFYPMTFAARLKHFSVAVVSSAIHRCDRGTEKE